jgi:mRNA interferase RelE/StbE
LAWTIEWDRRAARELWKLGDETRNRILAYLRDRVAVHKAPRRFGKPMLRNKAGLWRYRVGDYRIVCRIEDERLIVLVLAVGHRSEVYD